MSLLLQINSLLTCKVQPPCQVIFLLNYSELQWSRTGKAAAKAANTSQWRQGKPKTNNHGEHGGHGENVFSGGDKAVFGVSLQADTIRIFW
jgi:hypothetical protein